MSDKTEKKPFEIRISAQLQDGIQVGFVEYADPDVSVVDLNKRTDELVGVMTRQRAVFQLAQEQEQLAVEEDTLARIKKDREEAAARVAIEIENRPSGKATNKTQASVNAMDNNIAEIEKRIDGRKKGIESLKELSK